MRGSASESVLSRRQLIKRGAGGAIALGVGGSVVSACGGDSKSGSVAVEGITAADVAGATGTIKTLGWQFYRDDKAYNAGSVKARWSYLATIPDMWTKSRPARTFDVVGAGNNAMVPLLAVGRIAPIDTSLIENYDQIVPALRDDPVWKGPDGKVYAVPFANATAQLAWDAARASEPTSLDDLMKPELKGSIGLNQGAYVVQMIARALGAEDAGRLTKAQLNDAMAFLEKLKPQIKTIYQFGEEAQLFARGDIKVAFPSFGSVILGSSKNGAKVNANYVGAITLVDAWSVLSDGRVPAALNWIDRTISLAGQRGMATTSGQVPVVAAAYDAVPEGTLDGSVADVVKKAPLLGALPLAANAKGDQVSFEQLESTWNQFKASLT